MEEARAQKRMHMDDPTHDCAISSSNRSRFLASPHSQESVLRAPAHTTLSASDIARLLLADCTPADDLDARTHLALATRGVLSLPGAVMICVRDASRLCVPRSSDNVHVYAACSGALEYAGSVSELALMDADDSDDEALAETALHLASLDRKPTSGDDAKGGGDASADA